MRFWVHINDQSLYEVRDGQDSNSLKGLFNSEYDAISQVGVLERKYALQQYKFVINNVVRACIQYCYFCSQQDAFVFARLLLGEYQHQFVEREQKNKRVSVSVFLTQEKGQDMFITRFSRVAP